MSWKIGWGILACLVAQSGCVPEPSGNGAQSLLAEYSSNSGPSTNALRILTKPALPSAGGLVDINVVGGTPPFSIDVLEGGRRVDTSPRVAIDPNASSLILRVVDIRGLSAQLSVAVQSGVQASPTPSTGASPVPSPSPSPVQLAACSVEGLSVPSGQRRNLFLVGNLAQGYGAACQPQGSCFTREMLCEDGKWYLVMQGGTRGNQVSESSLSGTCRTCAWSPYDPGSQPDAFGNTCAACTMVGQNCQLAISNGGGGENGPTYMFQNFTCQ
jgi:hypothetical protein